MADDSERICVGCGDTEELARLERCGMCGRYFCSDCAHRAAGRRFCSRQCSQVHYFGGDDDDQDLQSGD